MERKICSSCHVEKLELTPHGTCWRCHVMGLQAQPRGKCPCKHCHLGEPNVQTVDKANNPSNGFNNK